MSLDDLFLTALRELAAENGVDWKALLRADAEFATGRTVLFADQVSEWVRVKGLFLKELKRTVDA
ncbi:hypothetical protein [Streptomyces sp. NPDC059906]|uniref:hypothetical protein n=1 Tax=Streptomyces sp. NPDC059906 TaxID=3346997 RepID=UPI00365ACBFF